ncbi:MAG: phosphoribosylaminoimidazolesuccinocarboxamide synthase [Deltaproteobacteria bacterium]|nr:phosphoribosylaminoimidazolesuccinocarboxamide synthase [Deltaproteobacteria bacterium]
MPTVQELLTVISADSSGTAVAAHSYGGLTPEQVKALAAMDHPTYTGKVRDVVTVGDELLIVHSDRLTAFDRLIATVPYKGTILTAISAYWLQEAQNVVPTHFIGQPHERVLRVERATPFKVEVVVRGYLAGSMQRAYALGERVFCGVTLPEGLVPYGRLPAPIITPTTKAAAFEHDENSSPAELIAKGVCTQDEWDEISSMALKLFAHGQAVFGRLGWLLVDTKYEFGRTPSGEIKVIDEIHTPDSSRLWLKETYDAHMVQGQAPDMLDKEVVRRYLLAQGFSGHGPVPHVPTSELVGLAHVYLKVAETLIGHKLETSGPGAIAIESLI